MDDQDRDADRRDDRDDADSDKDDRVESGDEQVCISVDYAVESPDGKDAESPSTRSRTPNKDEDEWERRESDYSHSDDDDDDDDHPDKSKGEPKTGSDDERHSVVKEKENENGDVDSDDSEADGNGPFRDDGSDRDPETDMPAPPPPPRDTDDKADCAAMDANESERKTPLPSSPPHKSGQSSDNKYRDCDSVSYPTLDDGDDGDDYVNVNTGGGVFKKRRVLDDKELTTTRRDVHRAERRASGSRAIVATTITATTWNESPFATFDTLDECPFPSEPHDHRKIASIDRGETHSDNGANPARARKMRDGRRKNARRGGRGRLGRDAGLDTPADGYEAALGIRPRTRGPRFSLLNGMHSLEGMGTMGPQHAADALLSYQEACVRATETGALPPAPLPQGVLNWLQYMARTFIGADGSAPAK